MLEQLISPISKNEFLTAFYGKQLLMLPNRAGDSPLLTWRDLVHTLENSSYDSNRFRLLKDCTLYPPVMDAGDAALLKSLGFEPNQTRFEPDVLYQTMEEGSTLIINDAHQVFPTIRHFGEELERDLNLSVVSHVVASCGDRPGFGLHCDPTDALIVQFEGEKHWKIYGRSGTLPAQDDLKTEKPDASAPCQLLWEGTVKAGDMIYLPKGFYHEVIGKNKPSLHLTLLFYNPTGLTFLNWLAGNIRDVDFFRKDVPHPNAEAECAAYIEELLGYLDDLLPDNALEYFYMARDNHMPVPYKINLPGVSL